jgi:hypothetical protein
VDIAAGEYGYDFFYFQNMMDQGCVEVLQADASHCGTIPDLGRLTPYARPVPSLFPSIADRRFTFIQVVPCFRSGMWNICMIMVESKDAV